MKPQVPKEFTQAVDNRQGGQFEAPPENFNRNEYYGKKIGEHYAGKFRERQANEKALKDQKEYAAAQALKSARSKFDGSTEGIDIRRRIAALKSKQGQDPKAEYQQELGFLQEELNYGRDQYIQGIRDKGRDRRNNASRRPKVQAPRPTNRPMGNKGSRDPASLQGGAPDILAQSPAKAQFNAYDARTGSSLSDTQLDKFYKNEAEMYRRAGGSLIDGGGSSQNPYLMSSGDRMDFEAHAKYQKSIADSRKPMFPWN
tara:strand:+ start:370 stop:1140 length:771 start_codon:yes stop_codon:yes gene_type:complete